MGFLARRLGPRSRLLFGIATNLANHNDRLGFRVIVKHFQYIHVARAV
jgi:hypothetical protein